MASFFLLLSLFVVAATASDEDLRVQLYWKKVLPNTPMPGAIKDIIQHVNVKGDEALNGKPGYKAVLEKDMVPGAKFTLHFVRTTAGMELGFLPRQSADAIPFSTAKLSEILAHLSAKPGSPEAEYIEKTLRECEAPAAASNVETKLCATSLESMVEYAASTLGTRDISALSTVMAREGAPAQKYTIERSGVKELSGSNFVACHARKYAYPVFYCHSTRGIVAYQVSMLGDDGTKVDAVAACHMPIAEPDSQSYGNFVRAMAGTSSVCHFLPQDHVMWMERQQVQA